MRRVYHWTAAPYMQARMKSECEIEGHILFVRRVRASEYVVGIDGIPEDKKYKIMKYAKVMVQNIFEKKYPNCRHEHRAIVFNRGTLTRYQCLECKREWEIDSSG